MTGCTSRQGTSCGSAFWRAATATVAPAASPIATA